MSDKLKCYVYDISDMSDISLINFFLPFMEIYHIINTSHFICTSHDRTSNVYVSVIRMLIWWIISVNVELICDKYKINIKKYIMMIFDFIVILCMLFVILSLSNVPYIKQPIDSTNYSNVVTIIEKPDTHVFTTMDID